VSTVPFVGRTVQPIFDSAEKHPKTAAKGAAKNPPPGKRFNQCKANHTSSAPQ
jgi:hypothetical protein